MKNTVICISREFGSGGRVIGQAVAEGLGIPFYDRSIIDRAAEATGLSAEFIEQEEQRFNNSMLFNLSMGGHTVTASGVAFSNRVFEAESEIIRELAEKGSCVIVGRCADYVLREHPDLFSVFICADIDYRIKRAVSEYGLPADRAEKAVRNKDKQRARHYHFYSDRNWGAKEHYDMILSSSSLGMELCADLIAQAVKAR
ncbi:MAG: cytidylate kinase-like family protein [Clostridia bacterium]|nr:cytidylate kinase-like family protein [Clostridia bacterium]